MTLGAFRARLRSERGMAVPTVLMLLIVGLGMSSAALVATTHSQSASNRDTRVKQAIAAADTGLDRAVYRENKIVTNSTLKCALQSGILGGPGGDGWCQAVTGTVGATSYSYRVKPWCLTSATDPTCPSVLGHDGRQITIVSTGTSGTISRRISEVAFAPLGTNVFGLDGAIGVNSISLTGNARIDANAGTNGSYSFTGNSIVCGDMRYGLSSAPPASGHQCAGHNVTQGSVTLPPPSTTGIAHNDISRFFAPAAIPGDTATGNVTWAPSTRDLTLSGTGVVTLGGDSYLLCSLKMSGSSSLIMASGANVKLYFDSPENCGNNSSPIDISGGARITSTAYNPPTGNYALPGIYVLGSDSISTSVDITGNGSDSGGFVLYAPRTDVTLTGNGSTLFHGVVAGKTLRLTGNAHLSKDANAPSPDIPTVLLYGRQRYVECTGATGTPPDANC